MCSLVSAEPSSARVRGLRERPVRHDAQRLLLDALAAALQDLRLAAVDQCGQAPLEDAIDAGSAHVLATSAANGRCTRRVSMLPPGPGVGGGNSGGLTAALGFMGPPRCLDLLSGRRLRHLAASTGARAIAARTGSRLRSQSMIGIIGGTGLYQMDGLQVTQVRELGTPFGATLLTHRARRIAGAAGRVSRPPRVAS